MTAPALVMLVVSTMILWGGLVGAVVNFRRHPELDGDE